MVAAPRAHAHARVVCELMGLSINPDCVLVCVLYCTQSTRAHARTRCCWFLGLSSYRGCGGIFFFPFFNRCCKFFDRSRQVDYRLFHFANRNLTPMVGFSLTLSRLRTLKPLSNSFGATRDHESGLRPTRKRLLRRLHENLSHHIRAACLYMPDLAAIALVCYDLTRLNARHSWLYQSDS